ncbi:activator-dependent family glycosyltransferase [Amycolatopsis lurida]
MRVLFTTYPEKTHFLAMAPLAWALRTAGHEVCFASQPKFTEVITQAGLTAIPVGSDRGLWQLLGRDLNWLRAGPGGLPVPYDTAEWHSREVTWNYLADGYDLQVAKWHRMSNVPMIPDLVDFARHWRPDLVIWEPTTYAGAIAAEACGAAHARLLFSIDSFGVTRDHFLRLLSGRCHGERADPLGDWLAKYAAEYGFGYSETLVRGQFTISLLPPSLRLDAALRYLPLRYVPYGGPAVVPDWLRDPPVRPRVALTLGLSFGDWVGFADPVRSVVDELCCEDIELVLTLGGSAKDELEKLPGNVRVVPYVPLHALVPTCSAVIHHAGFGTLATTALSGVPQLTVPLDGDGPALARRVAACGAGLAVHYLQTTGAVLRDCLARLLNEPGFAEGAIRLGEEMRAMPSPNELVPDLEELAAGPRPLARKER